MVPLCDIEADPENPRTVDVANTVDAVFVDSIREHGLLQAVTVRRMPADHAGSAWRIAYGGRRYAALVLIHGPKAKVPVPVLVTEAEGRGSILIGSGAEAVKRGIKAGDLAKTIAAQVGSGGGGRPDFAQTGFKGVEAAKVVEIARAAVKAAVGG